MTSCRQPRVPAVSIVRILSILGCLVLHVSHHFDLEVLDQLHFSLVKLGHRHLHTFMEPGGFNVKSLIGELFFNFGNNILLFLHLRLPLLQDLLLGYHEGPDTSRDNGEPTDIDESYVGSADTSRHSGMSTFLTNIISYPLICLSEMVHLISFKILNYRVRVNGHHDRDLCIYVETGDVW